MEVIKIGEATTAGTLTSLRRIHRGAPGTTLVVTLASLASLGSAPASAMVALMPPGQAPRRQVLMYFLTLLLVAKSLSRSPSKADPARNSRRFGPAR